MAPVTRVLVEVPLLAALLVLDLALLVALGVPGLLKTEHQHRKLAMQQKSCRKKQLQADRPA